MGSIKKEDKQEDRKEDTQEDRKEGRKNTRKGMERGLQGERERGGRRNKEPHTRTHLLLEPLPQ